MPDTIKKEQLVQTLSAHWMKDAHITIICLFLFCMGASLIGFSFMALSTAVRNLVFLCGAILMIFAYHRFFHAFLGAQLHDIVITDRRVIYYDDSILGYNDEHEVFLEKVAGVNVQQDGLLQKFFHYGTVWFESRNGTIALERSIPYVPNPSQVARSIPSTPS